MSRPITGAMATAALLAAAACGGGPPPPAGPTGPAPLAPVEAEDRLYRDNGEGIVDSVRIVVDDAGSLADHWARATRHQASPPPRPDIDFQQHMVVVVGAGRMTPQDRIRVDSVGIREVTDVMGEPERVLVVMVRTIQGCQQLDLDAYPVEIVRVPRFAGPVRFTGRTEQDPNCLTPTAAREPGPFRVGASAVAVGSTRARGPTPPGLRVTRGEVRSPDGAPRLHPAPRRP